MQNHLRSQEKVKIIFISRDAKRMGKMYKDEQKKKKYKEKDIKEGEEDDEYSSVDEEVTDEENEEIKLILES
jgi:hypothetical protein